ncbi:type III secretion protein [Pseudomonas fluorescens]|uniref:Type III secretion protein n=1 Tax=Pseudomonas fluorescens TaxID=294 RepID=A0A944DI91_PSEFL|nr:type III secretion protein [Pseudomonas fluorescens]MBT2298538.1 type III secretion protein [Pseudomonas fluorescens]MBT2310063.1 type III secretion protein [Pseudomonas fluorescens]MBT2311087.1 type III secretion protein [Pseudomonas fluorescens]MBT2319978.1 type III secretion protein [Pseudomonas fluorescens]MBT2328994.1 type III secretion protein [Pseudomonas fluorescens]
MSHSDTDGPLPANDPTLTDLRPTLDLLMPIRRHRLTMAEQAWQRHRNVLHALAQRLESMSQDLQKMREHHRHSRQQERDRHANRTLALSEMNDWLAGEQQALYRIERHEVQLKTLREQYRQQQQWTDDSQQQVRRRQRDVEKLDYLSELAQEAS